MSTISMVERLCWQFMSEFDSCPLPLRTALAITPMTHRILFCPLVVSPFLSNSLFKTAGLKQTQVQYTVVCVSPVWNGRLSIATTQLANFDRPPFCQGMKYDTSLSVVCFLVSLIMAQYSGCCLHFYVVT